MKIILFIFIYLYLQKIMRNLIVSILVLSILSSCNSQKEQITNTTPDTSPPATAPVITEEAHMDLQPGDSLNPNYSMGEFTGLTTVIENGLPLFADSLLENKTAITLSIGDTIYLSRTAGRRTDAGWDRHVYKVTVVNKKVQGYLPENKLAISVKNLPDGNIFLVGLVETRPDENDYPILWTKALVVNSDYSILSEKEFEAIGGETNEEGAFTFNQYILTQIHDGKGLNGATNIIHLAMNYDACGYTSGETVLIWDGKDMHYAFQNFEMSEAGLFANYAYAVFPKDEHGIEGKILSMDNHIEYDTEKEDMPVTLHDSVVVQYAWIPGKGVVLEDTVFNNRAN
jgi:hypothetical protein